MGRRKSEYVDFKRILRPGTVILDLLVMVLSFVAVKIVADSTAIRDGGDAIKGDSIWIGLSESTTVNPFRRHSAHT